MISVQIYPKLKKAEAEKFRKALHKAASPTVYNKEKKYVSAEELQARLAGVKRS